MLYRSIINQIFDYRISEYKKTLKPKEFISKQLKLLENKIDLLSFLGRKTGKFTLITNDSFEGIEINFNIGNRNSRYIIHLSTESFKYEKANN